MTTVLNTDYVLRFEVNEAGTHWRIALMDSTDTYSLCVTSWVAWSDVKNYNNYDYWAIFGDPSNTAASGIGTLEYDYISNEAVLTNLFTNGSFESDLTNWSLNNTYIGPGTCAVEASGSYVGSKNYHTQGPYDADTWTQSILTSISIAIANKDRLEKLQFLVKPINSECLNHTGKGTGTPIGIIARIKLYDSGNNVIQQLQYGLVGSQVNNDGGTPPIKNYNYQSNIPVDKWCLFAPKIKTDAIDQGVTWGNVDHAEFIIYQVVAYSTGKVGARFDNVYV